MQLEPEPIGPTRPQMYVEGGPGPVSSGFWLGVPAGTVCGVVAAAFLLWPAWIVDGQRLDINPANVLATLAVTFIGAVVGLCYGAVVGSIAGLGGWLTRQESTARRPVVSGLTFATGLATIAVVAGIWHHPDLIFGSYLIVLPLPMAVLGWVLAPRLP